MVLKLVFIILLALPWIHGAKILFLLPMSSKSMANIFEPLAVGLSERGHDLTIVTPSLFQIPASNKSVVVQHNFVTAGDFVRDYPNPFTVRQNKELYKLPIPWQVKYCTILYDNAQFRKLADAKFDLVIFNIVYHECFAGLLHKIGSPIILVATLPPPSAMLEQFGTWLPSSFVSIPFLGDTAPQMNLRQRTKNFLYNTYFWAMQNLWTRPVLEALYREKLDNPNLPSIHDVYNAQVSLVLQNSHSVLTNPRPLLPNVVEIGGIHCRPANPLPKDLEKWVTEAKDGFILFGLGSIVQAEHMPESVRKALLETFGKLKQRVLWKWEKDDGMPDAPKNVKVAKWLPQQDLLGHPNIKLFITHGGLLSTEETVYHKVPILGLPLFVDQDNNMAQAEILGIGLKAEIENLTEAYLTPLVKQLLDQPRYKQRVHEISAIFRDSLNHPLTTAVHSVEYVLRHKGAYHLRSAAENLNWIEYFSLDVIGLLALLALLVPLYALKILLSLCCGGSSGNSKPSKSVNSGGKKKKN